MSFQLNMPPSVVAREAKTEEEKDGDEMRKKSREDYKKMKELEEARKAGTVPAMVDEEGKDINPHIPQYIMQAPWYIGSKVPTLKHQREPEENKKVYAKMNQWFKKGVKQGPIATKFRKGACENCGAMTHKKKDCLERPRKTGAKFTGEDIAPDEHVNVDLSFDYEGKRDRWNGYDTDEHKRIIEDYAKLEEAKRILKSKNLDKALESGETETLKKDDDDGDDEDKYAEDVDMPGQKFETKQRITVRNLRIREDTAKYLYNLDPNSAYYDPKTRSMRENPLQGTNKDPTELGLGFSGDNFVRYSGDAHDMATQQLFAWEAYEKGAEVHLQADPTKLELLKKQYQEKKDKFEGDKKSSVLDKYGGEEHLNTLPKELLLAQTENYVEYSRSGKVIKGQEKAIIRSRYEEDIYNNNHTTVWGSYWSRGQWGYKCCHSIIKESYCTGEAGKEVAEGQLIALSEKQPEVEEEEPKSLYQQHQEKLQKANSKKKEKRKKKKSKKRKSKSSSSESSDSDSDEIDEQKLKLALLRQEEERKEADRLLAMDERKRPYNSMVNVREPTKEEMEAYRMKRPKFDDPMSQFM